MTAPFLHALFEDTIIRSFRQPENTEFLVFFNILMNFLRKGVPPMPPIRRCAAPGSEPAEKGERHPGQPADDALRRNAARLRAPQPLPFPARQSGRRAGLLIRFRLAEEREIGSAIQAAAEKTGAAFSVRNGKRARSNSLSARRAQIAADLITDRELVGRVTELRRHNKTGCTPVIRVVTANPHLPQPGGAAAEKDEPGSKCARRGLTFRERPL